jgi:hypothetical protein
MKNTIYTQIFDLLKKKIFDTDVFIKLMVGMAALCFYMLYFYILVSQEILPKGINYQFVRKSWMLLVLLISLLLISFFIYLNWVRKKEFKYTNSTEGFHSKDLLLMLLPMTPIMQYIILNQDILSAFDSIMVFVIFSAISLVLSFLVPMIFGIIGSRTIIMIVGISFSFLLFNMASISFLFSWHFSGNFIIQILILAIIFGISFSIYLLNKKILYVVVIAFFTVNTLSVLFSSNKQPIAIESTSQIYSLTKNKDIRRMPDIFLLTYDSYVENETMLQYGIDNSEQENYLEKNGFHIYQGTYTVSGKSIPSMGRVLDISSKLDGNDRKAVSGNGAVQNILKENGYVTFGIFDWDFFFWSIGSSYDYTFPNEIKVVPYKLIARTILEGEFRFNTKYEEIDYSDYLFSKRETFTNNIIKPKFVYTHTSLPGHSVNTGKCRDNEIELFEEDLISANKEMKNDIEIIEKNNPNSIIIVNGDHGPHLTKNCFLLGSQYENNEVNRLDIQDRMGSFLAIKWPDDANFDHKNINILQDIFPAVFSYIYEDDSILNSRIQQLTIDPSRTGGVLVKNGVIYGGKDDGMLLFNSMERRQ